MTILTNIGTLWSYEKKGSLSDPLRTDSRYRQCPQKETERIISIKNAKELGFSLSEIKAYILSLRRPAQHSHASAPLGALLLRHLV